MAIMSKLRKFFDIKEKKFTLSGIIDVSLILLVYEFRYSMSFQLFGSLTTGVLVVGPLIATIIYLWVSRKDKTPDVYGPTLGEYNLLSKVKTNTLLEKTWNPT